MRFGTVQFAGDLGKHLDSQGQECPGRFFKVKQVGTGAVYVNYVECKTCQRELPATEDSLLPTQAA